MRRTRGDITRCLLLAAADRVVEDFLAVELFVVELFVGDFRAEAFAAVDES